MDPSSTPPPAGFSHCDAPRPWADGCLPESHWELIWPAESKLGAPPADECLPESVAYLYVCWTQPGMQFPDAAAPFNARSNEPATNACAALAPPQQSCPGNARREPRHGASQRHTGGAAPCGDAPCLPGDVRDRLRTAVLCNAAGEVRLLLAGCDAHDPHMQALVQEEALIAIDFDYHDAFQVMLQWRFGTTVANAPPCARRPDTARRPCLFDALRRLVRAPRA
jgi:hypothetical protein